MNGAVLLAHAFGQIHGYQLTQRFRPIAALSKPVSKDPGSNHLMATLQSRCYAASLLLRQAPIMSLIRPMTLNDYDAITQLMRDTPGISLRDADSRESTQR